MEPKKASATPILIQCCICGGRPTKAQMKCAHLQAPKNWYRLTLEKVQGKAQGLSIEDWRWFCQDCSDVARQILEDEEL